MKQTQKSIEIPIELNVIEEIVKILGGIVNHKYGYCFDEIEAVKKFLINKAQNFIQDRANKEEE
jgi:hypothetical protein